MQLFHLTAVALLVTEIYGRKVLSLKVSEYCRKPPILGFQSFPHQSPYSEVVIYTNIIEIKSYLLLLPSKQFIIRVWIDRFFLLPQKKFEKCQKILPCNIIQQSLLTNCYSLGACMVSSKEEAFIGTSSQGRVV